MFQEAEEVLLNWNILLKDLRETFQVAEKKGNTFRRYYREAGLSTFSV